MIDLENVLGEGHGINVSWAPSIANRAALNITIPTAATTATRGIYLEDQNGCSEPNLRILRQTTAGTGYMLELDQDLGSGTCLKITKAAAITGGWGIDVGINGGGGINVALGTGADGDALVVGVGGTANKSGIIINITNTAATVAGLDVNYSGNGDATNITLGAGAGTASQALVIVGNSAVRTNALVRIDQTSANPTGNTFEINGPGTAFFDVHNNLSMRLRTDGPPSEAFVINNPDSGLSGGDVIFTLACNDNKTAGHNYCEFISAGPDIVFKVEDDGSTYNDSGTYGTGADYAEYMATKEDKATYAPGDILVVSGADEIDKTTTPNDPKIVGVYSTDPRVIGNATQGNYDLTSGTLESSSWEWVQEKGPRSNWSAIEIDGDQSANYAIGTTIRMAGSNTPMSVKDVSYNPGQNKTTVNPDQTWPLEPTNTELYYGVTERNSVPVAMLGQAPTKCITENGTISPGDLLVTSSTAGYAMKAGASPAIGTIIGKALDTLTDTGGGDDTGVINAYVNPS
jgi:hypothetical protein